MTTAITITSQCLNGQANSIPLQNRFENKNCPFMNNLCQLIIEEYNLKSTFGVQLEYIEIYIYANYYQMAILVHIVAMILVQN